MMFLAVVVSASTLTSAAKGGKHANIEEGTSAKQPKGAKSAAIAERKASSTSTKAISLTFEYTGKVDAHRLGVGKKGKKGPASGHIWTIGGWVPDETQPNDFKEVSKCVCMFMIQNKRAEKRGK